MDVELMSTPELRASISRGERTAECWAQLQRRNRRLEAARPILERLSAGRMDPWLVEPFDAGP
jgi:hypothetical protein